MTTLENFIVNPALYQSVGIEAQAGDQVELFLDQTIADPDLPVSIIGTIQPGMTRTCAGTAYSIEYDETDLDESGVDLLTPDMVLSAEIVSEAQVLFGIEEAARVAEDLLIREDFASADQAIQDQIDDATDTGIQDLFNPGKLVRWSSDGSLNGQLFYCQSGLSVGYQIVDGGFRHINGTGKQTIVMSAASGQTHTVTVPAGSGTLALVATYADDAAAATGGLALGDIYFTGTKFRARTA